MRSSDEPLQKGVSYFFAISISRFVFQTASLPGRSLKTGMPAAR